MYTTKTKAFSTSVSVCKLECTHKFSVIENKIMCEIQKFLTCKLISCCKEVWENLCSDYSNIKKSWGSHSSMAEDSGLWDVTLCCWVSGSWHFKGMWCLYHQGWSVTSEKTWIPKHSHCEVSNKSVFLFHLSYCSECINCGFYSFQNCSGPTVNLKHETVFL